MILDEDLPAAIEETLRNGTMALITALASNLDDGGVALVRDGVVVALIGPTNAGKSTILTHLRVGLWQLYPMNRVLPAILTKSS